MTPQELKNSILQLAIQGKLVEQRPEEGDALQYLAAIKLEREKQIGQKNAKVKKNLKPIEENEIPFEIPENWTWERFGNLANYVMGKTPPRAEEKWWGKGISWVSIADMPESGHITHTKEAITCTALAEKFSGRVSKAGTLLMSFKLTVGRVSILDIDAVHNEAIISIYPYADVDHTLQLYLFYVLPFITQYGDSKNAIKGKTLNDTSIANLLIPVPPKAEQKRIIVKIEELQPYIDRYEKAWSKLESFNARFPDDMKKSLLQLAMQGKLVEQRPEEGTGEELYRQIQQKKQKLIKEGKLKKEKPLPIITEEEKPFAIPKSWKWYRIGEVFNIVNGFTPLKSNHDFWTHGDIPWFTIDDVHRQGRFIYSTEKTITRVALSKNTERIVPADSVLLCCTASVGEYAYTKIPLTTNQQFNALVPKAEFKTAIFPMYIYEFVKTLKGTLIQRAGKTTFNFLSVGKLANLLIPIPPLAEQKRIVAKLEQLLPLCEKLK